MSVPAMMSNPGLALQGACFDLDDLQAMIEDYEHRMALERAQREKAEAHLASCLTRVTDLEGELAKLKNIVMGALAKVQGAPAPMPQAAAPQQPVQKVAPAPMPKPQAMTATKPQAMAVKKPAPAPAPAPVTRTPPPAHKPMSMAGQVPFAAPRPSAPQPAIAAAQRGSAAVAVDSSEKPKRRIMRSRRG